MQKSFTIKGDCFYHYTGWNELIGILSSRQLWLNHYKYVRGDKEEMLLSFQYIRERCRQVGAQRNNRFVEAAGQSPTLGMPDDVYMTCFAADDENDHLWETYAKKDGVCIAFDSSLIKSLERAFILPQPMEYDWTKFKNHADESILMACEFSSIEQIEQVITPVLLMAIRMKNADYFKEQELRLLHVPKLFDSPFSGFHSPLQPLENDPSKRFIDLSGYDGLGIKGIFLNTGFDKNAELVVLLRDSNISPNLLPRMQ